jgi:hypothetical protein
MGDVIEGLVAMRDLSTGPWAMSVRCPMGVSKFTDMSNVEVIDGIDPIDWS